MYRRPGQLSAEERAQRLAEMTGNATVHDEARWSRQRRAREQDDEEAAANEPRAAGNGLSPHSSLGGHVLRYHSIILNKHEFSSHYTLALSCHKLHEHLHIHSSPKGWLPHTFTIMAGGVSVSG